MDDIQILVVHTIVEECTILWVWFGGIALFNFSVIMHSFQKIISEFGKIQLLCTF